MSAQTIDNQYEKVYNTIVAKGPSGGVTPGYLHLEHTLIEYLRILEYSPASPTVYSIQSPTGEPVGGIPHPSIVLLSIYVCTGGIYE